MTVFFTGDQHFYDLSMFEGLHPIREEYANREEMEEDYIKKWNNTVGDDDVVFHVGDFCRGRLQDAAFYFKCLNGKVILLPGNHDMFWYREALKLDLTLISRTGHAVTFVPGMYLFEPQDKKITLFHYPLRQWPQSHKGSWHIHGHSHGKLTPWGRTLDVGVDTSKGYLYSLDDVITHFEQREQELPRNVSS